MTFASLVARFINIIQYVIPVIIGLGLLAFLYGLVVYLANGGNEEKRRESINYMVAGIIGLFIMFAVWGIVALLSATFTFGEPFGIPQIQP